MTSVIIPEFVLQMFEKEVTKINLNIIKILCEEYHLDEDDVKQKLQDKININFNIIHEDIEQIKIVKKHEQKSKQSSEEQCDARVYLQNDLVVKQCSRPRLPECNLCKIHQKLKDEGKLKYGTIHDEKPECISTEKLNAKIRRKLY